MRSTSAFATVHDCPSSRCCCCRFASHYFPGGNRPEGPSQQCLAWRDGRGGRRLARCLTPGSNSPEGYRPSGFFRDTCLDSNKLKRSIRAAAKGACPVNDTSTTVLQGHLRRAMTGDPEARQQLLEVVRDRLMRHACCFLHGRYARLEPFAQTDDVVQQLYIKILQQQDRFWVNADGTPVCTLAEFFGHTSAWMRDVLCDQLRK